MTLEDRINQALKIYLLKRNVEVEKVISFDESTREEGCCDTCAYTSISIEVSYLNKDGKISYYEINSSFSDLIRELTN